ncbi:MAG: hypothetical protein IIB67_02085 [Proteobacteria bacterium]|nr:hypothetical protein [Pseudomonadota bacterium]
MARQGIERRLTTIVSADVVGYSRLMAADEALAAARSAIERDPEISISHWRHAIVLIDAGREAEALLKAGLPESYQGAMINRHDRGIHSKQEAALQWHPKCPKRQCPTHG